MSAGAAVVHGPPLDASPGEYEDHLQAIAEQWYQNGMGDADKWMGQ